MRVTGNSTLLHRFYQSFVKNNPSPGPLVVLRDSQGATPTKLKNTDANEYQCPKQYQSKQKHCHVQGVIRHVSPGPVHHGSHDATIVAHAVRERHRERALFLFVVPNDILKPDKLHRLSVLLQLRSNAGATWLRPTGRWSGIECDPAFSFGKVDFNPRVRIALTNRKGTGCFVVFAR